MEQQQLSRHDIRHYHIPQSYPDDWLVLLYKDPYWLYAHWNITRDGQEKIKNRIHSDQRRNSTWALKIKPMGFQAKEEHAFFIPVGEDVRGWYIHVNQPKGTYMVEYGLLSQDYFFIPALFSNLSTTPPDQESELWNPYYVNIFDIQKMPPPVRQRVHQESTGSESYFGHQD